MERECASTAAWRPGQGNRFRRALEQFKAAWQAGRRPPIEEFLDQVDPADRTTLLWELLGLELELRAGAGEKPAQNEYETRLSAHPGVVAAVFSHKGLILPARIGRYQVLRRLGGGGFGHVYLCFDERARRQVAVKVPRADRFTSAEALDAFLREARNVARLDHPNIVQLYDCDEEAGQCFLVYKFVDGQSLHEQMTKAPLSAERAGAIVAQVADALQHAHSKNVFHRDIKPGNILLDQEDKPYITDFGLAVPEEELAQARGHRSGTLLYMSPEQIRGEGHRIDGRTDIYSLGVLFYELLTGRRPFTGKDDEVIEQILFRDPRPPRQIRDTVPREFERICIRAMAKQMNARYATARDMAEELRQALAWLRMGGGNEVSPMTAPVAAAPTSDKTLGSGSSQPLFAVVPKGLRSYGPEDSDFFLQLLPGLRDRDGLPESLRFWKSRIESRDAERSFAVGLLYGPSGCGKSSLVKAGLLPRLSAAIVPVYVEATSQDTEQRLVKALRQVFPDFGPELTSVEILLQLRKGRYLAENTKVLIVLDQFEQWLHGHGPDMETSEMVAALRHADGHNVSVLLLVRDDFWMGVSRLFDLLEINLDRERNARAVDLFDKRHAGKVLTQFGQAFERLPLHPRELDEDQKRFLDRAVNQLSEDGRVIPVRLSLFADLMKDRPWTMASLIEVGGAEGVGVRFLEETFSGRTALPDLRALEKPVRALLQALLPERGSDIKGRLRSRHELALACGLEEKSPRFHRLLEILDHELHIITPTEVATTASAETKSGSSSTSTQNSPPALLCQLTHDYMVPSLRQWLTQERQKTWRGRAELCLQERTAQWHRAKDKRFLPSLREFLLIATGTPTASRSKEQQEMLRVAGRRYGFRGLSVLCLIGVMIFGIERYVSSVRATGRIQRAESLVSSLLKTDPDGVPYHLEKLEALKEVARPLLEKSFESAETAPREKLHAAFALAAQGAVNDEFLMGAITKAPSGECKNLVAALAHRKVHVLEKLQKAFQAAESVEAQSRWATVLLHLGDATAAQQMLHAAADPSRRTEFMLSYAGWHGDLRMIGEQLAKVESPDFRSGLCAAVGTVPFEKLTSQEQDEVVRALSRLYTTADDAGTHTAAGWALRQWQLPLPSLKSADEPAGKRRWFANSLGLTMIHIPPGKFVHRSVKDPGKPLADIEITRPFFISDREINVENFRRMMDDANYPASEKPAEWRIVNESPSPDCPVQGIPWFDAVMFCNWLSKKEGRRACYRQTGQDDAKTWVCDFSADGYRLPTDAEWEYSCRAGTSTLFSFGDNPDHLASFAIFNENSRRRAWPVCGRIPNPWGLFDCHGNVHEWSHDWYDARPPQGTDPIGPNQGKERVVRGGGWYSPSNLMECASGFRGSRLPDNVNSGSGFRVVCGSSGIAKQ